MKKIQLILLGMLLTGFYSSAQVCKPPSSNHQYQMGLKNLQVSNINHTVASYGSQFYFDEYSKVGACVTAGTNYYIGVQCWNGPYTQAICVWVDWNDNDTFEVAEMIMDTTYISPGSTLSDSLAVPANQASGNYRMRVLVDYYYYYSQAQPPQAFDPCNLYYYGDISDFKISVVGSGGTDVGFGSAIQPYVLNIANNNPVEFTYTNLAGNNIDSFIAGYSVNGGNAVTESVTKTRSGSTLNLATCETDTFLFSQNLSISQAGNYDIKMWVSHANGTQPDANQGNDSNQITACTSLSGNYTIDKNQATSGSNYNSFSAAIAALKQCGISGPVTFTVAAGVYKDSAVLDAVSGASPTNTITFDGVDTANRIIQTFGMNSIPLTLNQASYIRIKHLTFKAGQYGTDLAIDGACTDILIDSCNFRVTSTINFPYYGVAFNGSKGGNTPATYVTVSNCMFKDMYYGIYLVGAGNTNGYGNKIVRNKINATQYGMICYYQDTCLISENVFRSAASYGIYAYDGAYNIISRNDLDMGAYSCIWINTLTNALIENNVMSSESGSSYASNFSNCTDLRLYHNTCYFGNASGYATSFDNCTNADVRNNIFHMTGSSSYCLYAGNQNQFSYLDFNVYHNANSSSNYVFLGGDYKTLAALKGQSGFNLYAVNAKPPFVNVTSNPRNLHLSSATIPSYGDFNVGVTIDIDSNSRCTIAPTIGADESKFNIAMPVSDFVSPDTAYINSPVFFQNKGSYTQGKFFDWYMDGASQPTYTSQDAWHTFSSTGSKEVKLNTTNCTGSHDSSKYVMIVTPTKAPIVYFKADKTDIDIMDEVQFMDSSTIGAVSWNWTITGGQNIGIGVDFDYTVGDSASQHPKVQFYNAGYYTVCLTATNSVGSTTLCKNVYIKVNSLMIMCAGVTVTDMFGRFYDDGGKQNNIIYQNQAKTCAELIAPCSGPITMTFSMVNFDSNTATLKIFDGVDATGKQLNKNGVKAGATLTAQSGFMFILWEQPSWTTWPGWEASWNTQYKYVAKSPASINTPDTGYSYGTQTYEVKYYKAGVQYDWDYNNDGTIDFQGRSGDYTFGAAGTYTCVCYATSCGGVDTVTKDVLVLDPTTPPEPVQFVVDVTNGSACKLRPRTLWAVENGVSVTLMDKSGKAPTSWEWDVPGANTANYTWDNGNTVQNPTITFVVNGFYNISLKVTNAAGSTIDTFNQVIKVVNAHCTPTVTSLYNQHWGISQFTFKDIDNKSNYYDGYTLYSYPIACVESGTWYKFSLKRASTSNNARTAIWIDYNQDGDFADAGELVKSTVNLSALTWNDSFRINKLSSSVLWGQAHMRVGITDPSNNFFNCGTNSVGEFEDYLLYIIDDNTPPVITRIGGDTLKTEQGLTFKDLGAVAYDLLDGVVPTISTTNLNTANLGYYWVKYDAKDKAGNYAYPVYRTVEVTADKSAPVITLLGNNPYYQNVNTNFTDPWATAYDSVDGNINNITTKGSVNTTVLGNYQIWYYAQDGKGYKDSVMRTVTVQDIAPPSLTLNGKDTIHLAVFAQYVDAGWSVNDNYDPNPTLTMNPAKIDSSVLQTTTITYTAKDATGNTATKTRVVIVEDLVAPVITLIGASPLFHEVKTTYTEPGATVTDNYTTGITPVITGGPVNPNVMGTYTLTYSATDGSGNTASLDRDVIVQKKTNPTVHLNGQDTVYLFVNQTYGDPGVNSISDSYYSSPQLMTLLQSSSTFANPATAPGTYYTWYFVTDPSSNTDTATRTFIVSTIGIRSVTQLSPITLWPNPANDVLNINGLDKGLNVVILYDAAGKQVLTETIKGENGTLNTATLAAGIYILKSVNDGKMAIARFEIAR